MAFKPSQYSNYGLTRTTSRLRTTSLATSTPKLEPTAVISMPTAPQLSVAPAPAPAAAPVTYPAPVPVLEPSIPHAEYLSTSTVAERADPQVTITSIPDRTVSDISSPPPSPTMEQISTTTGKTPLAKLTTIKVPAAEAIPGSPEVVPIIETAQASTPDVKLSYSPTQHDAPSDFVDPWKTPQLPTVTPEAVAPDAPAFEPSSEDDQTALAQEGRFGTKTKVAAAAVGVLVLILLANRLR